MNYLTLLLSGAILTTSCNQNAGNLGYEESSAAAYSVRLRHTASWQSASILNSRKSINELEGELNKARTVIQTLSVTSSLVESTRVNMNSKLQLLHQDVSEKSAELREKHKNTKLKSRHVRSCNKLQSSFNKDCSQLTSIRDGVSKIASDLSRFLEELDQDFYSYDCELVAIINSGSEEIPQSLKEKIYTCINVLETQNEYWALLRQKIKTDTKEFEKILGKAENTKNKLLSTYDKIIRQLHPSR